MNRTEMADTGYHIILDKVPEGRQPETALFLSGCFSLPPASTKGIAASAPIILLNDLTESQSQAIITDLAPSLPEGVTLRVENGANANKFSRLQWPRPPRIYGREVDEFSQKDDCQEMACPHCGEMLRIDRHGTSVRILPTAAAKRPMPKPAIATDTITADNDPLFSGVKPLVGVDSNFASLRSLDAGDTGFWMDYNPPAPRQQEDLRPGTVTRRGPDSSSMPSRKSGKFNAGLSAFMKPGGFALVVGRTRDSQVVKMIAEIMGISEDEAREKCMNLGICVARDIALDEAQTLLARFHNLGAKARIVRPT